MVRLVPTAFLLLASIARMTAAASAGPQCDGAVPRWYARLLVVMLALVAGFGGVGLFLALAGWFTPVPAALFGGGAAVCLAWLGWDLDERPPPRGGTAWSSAAVVLTVAWIGLNVPLAGEHVVVDRDPGVYLVAGRWLADSGTLVVDAGVGPFADAHGVSFESAGTYDEGGDSLDFQFTHLVPVLLAAGYWIGGHELLVAMPVLLGGAAILMTFALATRLAGRSWAGFLVAATSAVCLPVIGAVRDTYSEGTTWLLLSGGLWAWTRAADEQRARLAAFAGLALGAVAMSRVDAVVYLLAIPVLAGVLLHRAGHATSRSWRGPLALVAGIVPGVVLGVADILFRTGEYYRDLRVQIVGLWLALGVAVVVGGAVLGISAAGRRWPVRAGEWLQRHRRRLALGAACVVAAVGLAAWIVRPQVQVARSAEPFEYIGAIQAAEGHTVDPNRRYDERSVEWLVWYVGAPTVALGIAGAALVAARATGRRPGPVAVAWLALIAGTALYLWRPSITPDHLWATRRFVPAALPLILTFAATAIVFAVDAVRRRWRSPFASVTGLAFALAVFVPTAARTLPVAHLSNQHGYFDLTADLCAVVGGGAALAVEDERAGITLPQTLRSFCGIPVGLVAADEDPEVVARLAREWAAEDRHLVVVAGTPQVLEALVPGSEPVKLGPYESDQTLEVTVTRPPARLAEVSESFFVATVPSPAVAEP